MLFYFPSLEDLTPVFVAEPLIMISALDAFGFRTLEHTIDQAYVDGLSVTHGSPRQHIWSFAAGYNWYTSSFICW